MNIDDLPFTFDLEDIVDPSLWEDETPKQQIEEDDGIDYMELTNQMFHNIDVDKEIAKLQAIKSEIIETFKGDRKALYDAFAPRLANRECMSKTERSVQTRSRSDYNKQWYEMNRERTQIRVKMNTHFGTGRTDTPVHGSHCPICDYNIRIDAEIARLEATKY